MTFIKKVVMYGFKSFARKTEIPLENAMNVIVGPNGSGKSNITDAMCFVLGRLSMKSIRAPNAAGLLFSGNNLYKAASEGYVELIFDNSNKTFSIDSKELSIKRVVRKNGQSVYKINNETKTRQELLELLSQGGIDPDGFNIVLQGEIGSLVKVTPEDRRKILEEVAGISIYETRKKKSLHELEKTQEKLKEVNSILKERTSYLRNLEKQRQEALSYQKIEETIKRCKATILQKSLEEREKSLKLVLEDIEKNTKQISVIKKSIGERGLEVEKIQSYIDVVSKKIQSTGEQEDLYNEISELNAEIAGLRVKRENYDNRILSSQDKIIDFKEKKESLNAEIAKIKTSSPQLKKQLEKQKVVQEKLNALEHQRRRFYTLKSEISTLEDKKQEKEKSIIESKKEIQLIERSIDGLLSEIKHAKNIEALRKMQSNLEKEISSIESNIKSSEEKIMTHERLVAIHESDIKREEKIRGNIQNLKICFICKQQVEENHKHKITKESEEKIDSSRENLTESRAIITKNQEEIDTLRKSLTGSQKKLNELTLDEVKINSSEEKKDSIIKISKNQEELHDELRKINGRLHSIRPEFEKLKNVEEEYDEARLSLQELSFTDMDTDAQASMKKREISRLDVEIKNLTIDLEESEIESKKISALEEEKSILLKRKKDEEEKLYHENQELHEQKNEFLDRQKVFETEIIGLKHTIRNIEDRVNFSKIQKAEHEAQMEAISFEIKTFGEFEPIKESVEKIKIKLQEAQFKISRFGAVNMLALDAFEKVKEQCAQIEERAKKINEEQEKIVNIIEEIDKKKKKTFIKTLEAVNEYFTRNFSQLSTKGQVFLELQNKKEPFEAGLDIIIKVSRGKYFDVRSLSGGERTLVALSLIFAIQEYKPYSFYIFDEIDAALDKRNSERLAALIKKYMTTGQYIIITHNDTLITEATSLYGVSMHENISKVISLKV